MDTYCAKLMEYEKYLIANSLVPNGKAGYYVNWVDKFLHGINYREEGVNQSSFISFVNLMQKDKRYADWLVRQVENAVKMYIGNFLKINMNPKAPTKSPVETKDPIQKGMFPLN